MEYRTLGRTGLRVSAVALGCEGFMHKRAEEVKADFDFAIGHGINFVDIYSSNPDLRADIGAALEGRRGEFIIQGHLCTVWENDQYLRTRDPQKSADSFERQLRQLRTDYLDVGMIHYVDAEADLRTVFDGPIIRLAQRLKAEGRIRSIGLSSHNPAVARMAVETGLVDVLMFSINPAYDLQPASENVDALWADESYARTLHNVDPERERLYELCERTGVGIDAQRGELALRPRTDARAVHRVCAHAPRRGGRHGRLQEPRGDRSGAGVVRRSGRRTRLHCGDDGAGTLLVAGTLHVLRPLRPLFGGHRHRGSQQIPQPRASAGRDSRNGARTLPHARAPRLGVHRLRAVRTPMPVRRRDRRRTVRILKRQTMKRNTTFLTDDQRLQLIDLLHVEACSCVIRNGDVTRIFRERGVKDLYRLLEEEPELLDGAFVADKVVGKGAAALMILGGVGELHADVISRPARLLLAASPVHVSYTLEVPYIVNRTRTGQCPVETLCRDCATAAEALPLIRNFIEGQK